MKNNTIVTISRQYGSGGRAVAELLAKKMNSRCYDRQIVYMAATKMGNGDLDIEHILEESYQLPGAQRGILGAFGIGGSIIPEDSLMYKKQAAVIKEIAAKSGGVFLGRCADAVLGDAPNCYHIYTYADDEFREERGKKEYNDISLKELDKIDKDRQRYYNYYTGRTWGDPVNYDLMINIGKVGIEQAANLILDLIAQDENQE